MNKPVSPDSQGSSTRPYLIRALHDWCTDNGFTPYLAVFVDAGVQVPTQYVKNNEIVLNVGFEATTALKLGNEFIEFKARFGGVAREIVVPVDHVVAIYARENGQGMAFPMPSGMSGTPLPDDESRVAPVRSLRLARSEPQPLPQTADAHKPDDDPPEPDGPAGSRPALKRIK